LVVGLTFIEKDWVLQRVKGYCWKRQYFFRIWSHGHVCVVPHVELQINLVKHTHEELGHFGACQIYSLL
jgi:hypothetical protein